MTKQISQSTGNTAPIKVGDAEGVIEAIASAPYRSILPRLIGDSDPRLSLLEADHCAPMLERELWLMTRADMAKLARIKVTGDWLVDIFNGD